MYFFLTLKKVVNVLTEDILVSCSRSTEQTNDKKSMDLNGTANFVETESDAQVKANDLQLRKEISLWLEDDYLYKNHIHNSLANDLMIISVSIRVQKRFGKL